MLHFCCVQVKYGGTECELCETAVTDVRNMIREKTVQVNSFNAVDYATAIQAVVNEIHWQTS